MDMIASVVALSSLGWLALVLWLAMRGLKSSAGRKNRQTTYDVIPEGFSDDRFRRN